MSHASDGSSPPPTHSITNDRVPEIALMTEPSNEYPAVGSSPGKGS